jgi:glycosyltransferase involved in cell wall biosynthesis
MPAVPVLYVLNSLGFGGTERQLVLTLRALDREAFPPAVAVLFKGGPHEDELRSLGIPITVLHARRRGVLGAARSVARLAREHGAAIIHTALFESNVAGRLAARRVGGLAVSHLVNEYESPLRAGEPEPRTRLAAAAVKAIERWTARRARSRFVAVAEVVAESAASYFGVDRRSIPVVRRGFTFDELEAAAARPVEAPAWAEWAETRLLAVGRLNPQKGHRYLARAVSHLVEAIPKAQVAIAGDGALRAEIAAIARETGQEEHLRLVGARADVPALIRAADAFVFPSLWEGAAGAFVEAAALGTPIVASDIPALREMLPPDLVTYVRPGDPAALAEGVVRTVADLPAARDRAVRAADLIRAEHDIDANTMRLESCYRTFLAGTG